MARYAIVKNSKVRNLIEASAEFIASNVPNAVLADDDVHIGDVYDGVSFSRSPREINKEARALKQYIKVLLRQTDWTVDSDNNLTAPKRDEWRTWRQSLRAAVKTLDNTALADYSIPDAPGDLDEF